MQNPGLTLRTGANSRYVRNRKQHHEKSCLYFLYCSRETEPEIRPSLGSASPVLPFQQPSFPWKPKMTIFHQLLLHPQGAPLLSRFLPQLLVTRFPCYPPAPPISEFLIQFPPGLQQSYASTLLPERRRQKCSPRG